MLCDGPGSKALLPALRRITGASVATISEALTSRAPLLNVVLFRNDHEEHASKMTAIIDEAAKAGVQLRVFELREDESFESCPKDRCEISIDGLRRILDQFDELRGR